MDQPQYCKIIFSSYQSLCVPDSCTTSGHLDACVFTNEAHKSDEMLSNTNTFDSHGSCFWESVCKIRLNYYFCEYGESLFEKWTLSGEVIYQD